MLRDFELWCRKEQVEVVGESFHFQQIRPLFPPHLAAATSEYTGTAILAPEPGNPHDPSAVAVVVEGRRIGYLPKDTAPAYSRLFQAMARQGLRPTTPVRIHAYERPDTVYDSHGHSRTVMSFQAYARVTLSDAQLCFPVNQPPAAEHVLIPMGRAVRVTGEEEHTAELSRWVQYAPQVWVWATLHVVEGTGRSKPRIEIQVDGAPTGLLSPASSAHFLPTVKHLSTLHKIACGRLLLRGNALRVEASLYAAKVHEIDNDWVSRLGQAPAPVSATEITAQSGPRSRVFNPPPGWPRPPEGWEPPPGWEPSPHWPRPPQGWVFWVPAGPSAQPR